MCDRAHFDDLESAMSELKDDVTAVQLDMRGYHARTDARLYSIEKAVESLAGTVGTLLKALVATLVAVVIIAVLSLVYGAVGANGFNAVSHAASELSPRVDAGETHFR